MNFTDENGNNTLHMAVFVGHDNCIETLITAGADVNSVTKIIETALMLQGLFVLQMLYWSQVRLRYVNATGKSL